MSIPSNTPLVEAGELENINTAPVFPSDATDEVGVTRAATRVQAEAEKHSWRLLAILSALMAFASISTDLYLPAMPTMGRALQAPKGTVEWTVSGFLIGFSLGQLVWGPIADRIGRRRPLAIGLILFVIGSVGCALAGSIWAMIGWRMVQAVGASAGVVLARAMVRDLFVGDRAAQMMSSLMTVMAIGPLIGPLVGGQILALAGWRATFWTLVGVGVLTLAAVFTLPETLPDEKRSREPMIRAFTAYGELLRQSRLLGYAGAGGFFYGGMFAYIAGTPFAYITYYHLRPQFYGLVFGLGVVGIMGSNFISSRLVTRLGVDRLLVRGASVAALAGILLLVTTGTGWGGLPGLVLPLLLFMSVTGFIVANSISGALAAFPQRAGAVSALVGALQYGSGIIGSALVGAFADGTPWPMGWVIALAGLGSCFFARVFLRPKT